VCPPFRRHGRRTSARPFYSYYALQASGRARSKNIFLFFFERAAPRSTKNQQSTSGSFNEVTIPCLPQATAADPSPNDTDMKVSPKNHPKQSPEPSIADDNASMEDLVAPGDDEASQCHTVVEQAAGPVEALPTKIVLPQKPRPPAKASGVLKGAVDLPKADKKGRMKAEHSSKAQLAETNNRIATLGSHIASSSDGTKQNLDMEGIRQKEKLTSASNTQMKSHFKSLQLKLETATDKNERHEFKEESWKNEKRELQKKHPKDAGSNNDEPDHEERAKFDLQKCAAKLCFDTQSKADKQKNQPDANNNPFNQVGALLLMGAQNGQFSFGKEASQDFVAVGCLLLILLSDIALFPVA
jgi:hypothetical protein